MPNNVYIGSRYVPIFDGAWNNTKSYEALTIVEYGNNTYTSKKPVPVGTLPTNTTYWALTGNYNGQISALDTRVTDLEAEMATIGTLAYPRRIVCISDSYADKPTAGTGFPAILQSILTDVADFYNFYQGSMGFTHVGTAGTKCSAFITSKISQVSHPETITDFLVMIGLNDYDETETNIKNDIQAAINVIKTNFPIARIWFGFPGNSYNFTVPQHDKMVNVIRWIEEKAGANQCRFMSGLEYIMHDVINIASDLVHPTAAGSQEIANAIAIFLNGGTYTYKRSVVTTLDSDIVSGSSTACYMSIDGNIGRMTFTSFTHNGNYTFAQGTFVKIATVADEMIRNINNFMGGIVAFDAVSDDPVYGELLFIRGSLYFKASKTYTNIHLRLMDCTMIFNMIDC